MARTTIQKTDPRVLEGTYLEVHSHDSGQEGTGEQMTEARVSTLMIWLV